MTSILPFDELNKFKLTVRERYGTERLRKDDTEGLYDIIDMMLDLFLLSYAMGNRVTNENLGADASGKAWTPTAQDAETVINRKIKDKTWRDRVREHFENGGTAEDLIRIAETESHRDANESAVQTATKAGAKTKTWTTMMDEKVRDQHSYLEGMTVSINEDFYTYDGDHASAPGLFALPENNINCRCELVFN